MEPEKGQRTLISNVPATPPHTEIVWDLKEGTQIVSPQYLKQIWINMIHNTTTGTFVRG